MKYRITRTSDWDCKEKPHRESYQEGVDKYDRPIWVIEINSLEDLHKIIEEEDHTIIVDVDEIEIYDDFRE